MFEGKLKIKKFNNNELEAMELYINKFMEKNDINELIYTPLKKAIMVSIFYSEKYNPNAFDNDLLLEIAEDLIENNTASINFIQTNFCIGFNRAQRVMGKLEELGIISPKVRSNPRKILVSKEEAKKIINNLK